MLLRVEMFAIDKMHKKAQWYMLHVSQYYWSVIDLRDSELRKPQPYNNRKHVVLNIWSDGSPSLFSLDPVWNRKRCRC